MPLPLMSEEPGPASDANQNKLTLYSKPQRKLCGPTKNKTKKKSVAPKLYLPNKDTTNGASSNVYDMSSSQITKKYGIGVTVVVKHLNVGNYLGKDTICS